MTLNFYTLGVLYLVYSFLGWVGDFTYFIFFTFSLFGYNFVQACNAVQRARIADVVSRN